MDEEASQYPAWVDRRRSARLPVTKDGVHVKIRGGRRRIRVRDLSADGLRGIWLPGTEGEDLQGRQRLLLPAGSELGIVLRPVTGEDAGLVRATFQIENRDDYGELSHFLAEGFVEQALRWDDLSKAWPEGLGASSRDWVRQTIEHFTLRLGREVRVFAGGTPLPILLRVKELATIAGRQVLVCRLRDGALHGLANCGEMTFGFAGGHSVYLFHSSIWRVEGDEVLLLMPGRLRQTAFRWSRRSAPLGAGVEVWIRHPRFLRHWLRRPLQDVSSRGLSFHIVPRRDLLAVGECLDRVRVNTPWGLISAQGLVRSFSRRDGALLCGLELTAFGSEVQAARWERYALQLSHPKLRIGTRASLKDAWQALEASRFIEEISPQLRPRARTRFLDAWRRFADKPELSRYLLLVEAGRPAGIVAASLLYPGTWMPHHFGLDAELRSKSKRVLFSLARENLSGLIELLLSIEGLEHCVFFVDANKDWNELLFGKFIRRYPSPARARLDANEVWKGPVAWPDPYLGSRVQIIDPNPSLMGMLQRRIVQSCSLLEREAMALLPERMMLEDFSRKCQDKGYARKRWIHFAQIRGRPVAALMAEIGPEGLNLFGLFDQVRLVSLRAGAERDSDVVGALLGEARRHYARQGKQEFVFLQRPDQMAAVDRWGVQRVAGGLRFLIHRSALPAWKAYIEDLMLMLESKPSVVLW